MSSRWVPGTRLIRWEWSLQPVKPATPTAATNSAPSVVTTEAASAIQLATTKLRLRRMMPS